jgi:hypothetical protein
MVLNLEHVAVLLGVLIAVVTLETFLRKRFSDGVKRIFLDIQREVQTGNGSTLGEYSVATRSKINEVAGMARDNRTLLEEYTKQMRELRDDLLRHQVKGH